MSDLDNQSKSVDDLLLELTDETTDEETTMDSDETDESGNEDSKEVSKSLPISISDINDLKEANIQEATVVPLSDQEYMILAEFSDAVPKDTLSDKYNISVREINKLIRQPSSIAFLNTIRENKEQETLSRLSGLTNRAVESKVLAIDTLLNNGNESTAFAEMFGKLSMVEVMEKLNKLKPEEEKEDGNGINVFFNNLTGRN